MLAFVSQLPPLPNKRLRDALHKPATGKADIKWLKGRLEGYHRLRSGSYRVVFRQRMDRGQQVAECIYAAPRALVKQQH
ncbi:MAG: type II toxin-antitoxin system RelE family toxin [Prosthecobacter sp.]|uniref:type II toxin-antitoxin system RelE family toxin n=1 Tax=Prosthecobacter sp. TaxID=1965333 RepID=UPI0038FDCE51